MDRSAMPWRVLDDDAEAASAGAATPDSEPQPDALALTPRLLLGLALAGLLAVAAFALAATGSTGSVEVGGAGDWPSPGASAIDPVAGGPVGTLPGPVVDVQGAVRDPGVQRLPAGSRVGDAISAAGGYGPGVDASRAASELNLAAQVKDGDRIVVPGRGDPAPSTAGRGSSGSESRGALVDVNTASASELDTLPGVGPKTAEKIIAARAEKPFTSVDELRDRKIVGAATFEKLKSLVTVR